MVPGFAQELITNVQEIALKAHIFFSFLAGSLSVLAFGIYNRQILQGNAVPNIASWAVWSFVTLLNFTSYKAMSKDGWKSFLPTISSIQCVLTFFLALFYGEVKGLSLSEGAVLVLGVVAGLSWWKLKSSSEEKAATTANMMLQFCIFVGFIPTFQAVWMMPKNEAALCWFLWTASFLMQTVVVGLRWQGKVRELVYPINCAILHLAVALLALR